MLLTADVRQHSPQLPLLVYTLNSSAVLVYPVTLGYKSCDL